MDIFRLKVTVAIFHRGFEQGIILRTLFYDLYDNLLLYLLSVVFYFHVRRTNGSIGIPSKIRS